VLKRLLARKREEICLTGGQRKLSNEKINNCYYALDIGKGIKIWRRRWGT
jgi:hypothetical protein